MMVLAPAPPSSAGAARAPLVIDTDRCKGCGLCVTICPPGVLALEPTLVNRLGYHPVRLLEPDRCTSCALCYRVCPDTVFTVFAPRRIRR